MKRLTASLTAVVILALFGCARHPTAPGAVSSPQVVLDLTLSTAQGSPSQPVDASGVALNNGPTTAAYPAGCTPYAGVYFSVLDSKGQYVFLHDPTALLPLCAVGLQEFKPGERVAAS